MNLNSGSSLKKEETVLLLTGAINVHQSKAPFTFISQPEERIVQYVSSIEYAIEHYHLIENIVFCENTNFTYDYASLIEKAHKKGKELEVLTFEGNLPEIQQRGKGYGEGEAIEYALKNSILLKKCQSFFKLTGRLMIKNLDQVATSTKAENGFIWHPKEIYKMKNDHVETYFFKVTKEFYNARLLDAYKEVDEMNGLFIEHIFYERLKELNIKAFKYPLQITGNSGTSGKPYFENKNTIRMERICCAIGAHNIQKNVLEMILTALFAWFIKIRNKLKKA